MRARVIVTLKAGVLDPQGKAIEGALASLGVAGIRGVRQGKVFDIELDGEDRSAAEAALGRACERLLANTVIENYRIENDRTENDRTETAAGDARPSAPPAAAATTDAFAPDAPVAADESPAEAAAMPAEGHP